MATNFNSAAQAPETVELRLQKLEAQVSEIYAHLQTAIAAQEQLHEQLRRAVDELSEALRNGAGANRVIRQDTLDPYVQRLETRLRGVEHRIEKTSGQVAGILNSRIWRTLVRGSGVFTRFLR